MTLQLVTGPSIEPLEYEEVLDHLRIADVDEESDESSVAYIERLIKAVRLHLERVVLNRSLITQTWKLYLNEFPYGNYIEIPYPKLQSISSLKYTDSTGVQTTWAASNYIVDSVSTPGRLVLTYLNTWPVLSLYPSNPIEVQFVSGYGSLAEDVPEPIKQAMLMMISDLYENREEFSQANLKSLGLVESYLFDYRVIKF
jgi:uncharacterized phiE125 gp8 family phage protein